MKARKQEIVRQSVWQTMIRKRPDATEITCNVRD